MKFTYGMPDTVKSVRYEPNTHFVELEDKQGRKTKMPATALLKCSCRDPHCGMTFYVESNLGELRCPHCGARSEQEWGHVQLSFVPEVESDFSSGLTEDLVVDEGEGEKDG